MMRGGVLFASAPLFATVGVEPALNGWARARALHAVKRMKLALIAAAACIAGCAHEDGFRPEALELASTTSAARPIESRGVRVSSEIVRACELRFGDTGQAPEFGYDQIALDHQARDLLAEIAKCLVAGPLTGRRIRLVGRTDAVGAPEYNMMLGAERAHATGRFLVLLGVEPARIRETSRGELDATGVDEAERQRDRRVDVELE